MEEIKEQVNENSDSITHGAPTKGGSIKIYGDFSKIDEFKKKIDNAKLIKEYANANLEVNK